jgi:death-on-curing protein
MAWRWVADQVALAAHREQIAAHGGAAGIRDRGLFESAMARPQNLLACGEPDLAQLAAAYAYGIARNHPFLDGNKRTAAVVAETFIRLNSGFVSATDAEVVVLFLGLAAGEIDEEELAEWFRARIASTG